MSIREGGTSPLPANMVCGGTKDSKRNADYPDRTSDLRMTLFVQVRRLTAWPNRLISWKFCWNVVYIVISALLEVELWLWVLACLPWSQVTRTNECRPQTQFKYRSDSSNIIEEDKQFEGFSYELRYLSMDIKIAAQRFYGTPQIFAKKFSRHKTETTSRVQIFQK